jgi:hypothetical protein
LHRSKTVQDGAGREISIPLGRTPWCPVAAVTNRLDAAALTDAPVFRPVDRHGNVGTDRLSGEGVCLVVRARVAAAGIDLPNFSSHSLCADFATSAAHASDAILARDARHGEQPEGIAAGALP